MSDVGFWLGVVGGALVGGALSVVAGLVLGGVVGMVFWGEDKAREWQGKYWDLRRKRGQAVLEITLKEVSGKVVALHNLVSLPPDLIMQALRLVALGRDFTVRQMQPLLTEEQFNLLRNELEERGYLINRGPRRTAGWTPQGEALLDEIRRNCLSLSVGRGEKTAADSQPGGGVVGIAAFERGLAIGGTDEMG